MNADRLLEVYEQISEAPDAIARMRRFVLDLAVRGKLTAPDFHGHTAQSLVDALQTAKVKAGNKSVFSVVKPEEIPFELPEHWTWSRVGEICLQTGSGSTPRGGKSAYVDEGILFLRSQNVYDDGLRLSDVAFIPIETHHKMARTAVRADDILLNITGGSIGRCALVPSDFDTANVSQHVSIVRCGLAGFQSYLHLVIRSPYFQKLIFDEQNGAGREGLPKKKMDLIPIPLPPDQTQYDIVAKVDELMALCDRLEEARKTREEVRDKLTAASLARLTAPDTTAAGAEPAKVGTGFASGSATTEDDFPARAHFALDTLPALTTRPDQIKTRRQTILNLAVRGKLVEQDPSDEPASELLKRITVEKAELVAAGLMRAQRPLEPVELNEREFDLPDNWVWVRLGEVVKLWNGLAFKSSDFATEGIPVIRIGDLKDGAVNVVSAARVSEKIASQASGEIWIPDGALLLAMSGATTGKTAFNTTGQRLLLNQRVGRIEPFQMNIHFIRFFFETIIARNLSISLGTAIPNLSAKQINETAIPLPPLAEQNRIVAKVDALMALCDQLEAALTTTDTTRTRLLEALLHEALEPASKTLEFAE